MKCFYHNDLDAVGTCSQCGKASCRQCIEDVGGALLCRGCLALHAQAIKQEEAANEAEREQITASAKRRLRISWIVFAASSIFGLVIGTVSSVAGLSSDDPNAPSAISLIFGVPLGSLLAGYLFWAMFWGVPVVWRWWWGLFEHIGCFLVANPVTWFILIAMVFYIPLIGGYLYGTLGGGVYEYVKCSRRAKGEF